MTMRFDLLTLFPGFFDSPLRTALLGKAVESGVLSFSVTDLRDFAEGKHKQADDYPFGGGAGMVMKIEPLARAIDKAREKNRGAPVVLMTPQGRPFTQETACRYAELSGLVLVCGRYEGLDARVESLVDEQVSVGDFVLAGGETAALCVIEAVSRLVPGVVGNEDNLTEESLPGRLKYPQYTRPREFRGVQVPDVLLSGDHARIAAWRKRESLRRTLLRRPDLLENHPPDAEEEAMLEGLTNAPDDEDA